MNKAPISTHAIFAALLALLIPLTAQAIPFSSEVIISGSIEFDEINSNTTDTTQSGSIKSTIGGSTSSSIITGASIAGTNPLAGTFTDIGDGVGSSFTMNSNQNNSDGGLFSDFAFNITNNSATDQYQVSFSIDFSNSANADGTDAFVHSQFVFDNDTLPIELFFSDLTSDIPFGDIENGVPLPSFGASLNDTGSGIIFDFLLNPLESLDLSGFNELTGGVFDVSSSFNGTLESFISIASVSNLTNPTGPIPAPIPSTLFLLGAGLAGFIFSRKAKPNLT